MKTFIIRWKYPSPVFDCICDDAFADGDSEVVGEAIGEGKVKG